MASDPSRPDPTADTPAGRARAWRQRRTPATHASPPRPGRLDLGDAIHDGWQAFCRAPRVFAVFALVVNLVIVLQQPLLWRIGSGVSASGDPRDWALYGLGLALVAAALLWGSLGLGRGALLALRGQRPTLMELLRWDGRAWLRLLRAWLRLTAQVSLPAGMALLLFLSILLLGEAGGLQQQLGQEATRLLALLLLALLLLCVALTLVGLLYLSVNQLFLLPIVLLEGHGGGGAVERGRQLVDPQWPLVLLLLIVSTLLHGLGLLACWVGSLAAWPAVICITTAAYQQLRDSEEHEGEAIPPSPTEPDAATP